MIYYTLIFIAYFALTSILHWWANRPKYMTIKGIKRPLSNFGGSSLLSSLFKNYYQAWADELEKSFPDFESCRKFIDTSPLYVFANEETAKNFISKRVEPDFVDRHPELPPKTVSYSTPKDSVNFYQSALAIPWKERTPFEKWKASDPANTWVPWWLSKQVFNSMEDVAIHEHQKEQAETQEKAFGAGLNAFTEKINSYIELLDNVLNK